MEGTDASRVDIAALLSIADRYQGVGDLVGDAVRMHLGDLKFDGAGAGRAYIAHGDAVRSAVGEVVSLLWRWSRACSEIAAALRVSADRYAETDVRAGRRMG